MKVPPLPCHEGPVRARPNSESQQASANLNASHEPQGSKCCLAAEDFGLSIVVNGEDLASCKIHRTGLGASRINL